MQQNTPLHSLITELELHSQQPSNLTPSITPQLSQLTSLKASILDKMQQIDTLNVTYKQKTEFSFLKTFKKIMDSLSSQLINAVQAYQNIDQEIQRDPKCLLLTKQLEFYKQERQNLEGIYDEENERLDEVRMRNFQLKRKRNELKRKSVLLQEDVVKYGQKNRSLSLRLNRHYESLENHPTTNPFYSQNPSAHNRKKHTQSTKYHTSADKTRIMSFNSQNKKIFFQNSWQDNQNEVSRDIMGNKSSNKNTKTSNSQRISRGKKVFTSENVNSQRRGIHGFAI